MIECVCSLKSSLNWKFWKELKGGETCVLTTVSLGYTYTSARNSMCKQVYSLLVLDAHVLQQGILCACTCTHCCFYIHICTSARNSMCMHVYSLLFPTYICTSARNSMCIACVLITVPTYTWISARNSMCKQVYSLLVLDAHVTSARNSMCMHVHVCVGTVVSTLAMHYCSYIHIHVPQQGIPCTNMCTHYWS